MTPPQSLLLLLSFALTLLLPAGTSAQSSASTPAQSTALKEAAQKWGLRQMSHMLADRPVMKCFTVGEQTHWVTREDSIWKWVAERYAGKVTGFWAAWHEAPPTFSDAMHAYGPDKVYIYAALPVNDATAPDPAPAKAKREHPGSQSHPITTQQLSTAASALQPPSTSPSGPPHSLRV